MRVSKACVVFTALLGFGLAEAQPFDHTPLGRVLGSYVDDNGQVAYADLKVHRAELDMYVDSLAAVSPKSHPDRFPHRNDALAYWINAYNALVVRGVIDAYPVKSVKEIKRLSGFFNRTWFTVGGESLTLNKIEHDILRKEFDEPRIHAAINCASVGCPRLEQEEFQGHDILERLESAMGGFLNDPRNVTIDSGSKQVTVSKILDWFKPDFIGWYNREFNVDDARILDYVALYVGTAGATGFDRAWEVRYHNYDWALNDQQ